MALCALCCCCCSTSYFLLYRISYMFTESEWERERVCVFFGKTVTVINYGKWFGKYYIWYVFFFSLLFLFFLIYFASFYIHPLPLLHSSMMCVLFCCCRFNNMNDYIRIQNLFLIEIKKKNSSVLLLLLKQELGRKVCVMFVKLNFLL